MRVNEKYIQQFVDAHNYDIREMHNARFSDQKCIPDVVNAVAECVLEYTQGSHEVEFSKNDIWHSDYSRQLLEESFTKPDTENVAMQSEYDKFFAQPLKMFAAAGVLIERKDGNQNIYHIEDEKVLDFVSTREKNALIFLDIYLTKVMRDSGYYQFFEAFFQNQDKISFNYLRDALVSLFKDNTPIRGDYEPPRIYNKIINILAFRRRKKGSVRGNLSDSIITIDEIRYNRLNWRDIAKPKEMSRQEYAQAIGEQVGNSQGYYNRAVEQAKRFVRSLEEFSEVHRYPAYAATDAHHIFMKSEYPELADMPENIIALTGTEHYSYAHPNRNTQRIDPNYQMICLISKLDSIERNFQEGRDDYSLADFSKILNEGLGTDKFNAQMGFELIKASLLSYLRPVI